MNNSPSILEGVAVGRGSNIKGCRGVKLVEFQYSEEGRLGHFHIANLAHTLFTSFLFFQQFALTGDIATVALGGHILTHGLNGLTRDDFGPNGSLDGYFKLLARNEFFQFLANTAAKSIGVVGMYQRRQCVNGITIQQNV